MTLLDARDVTVRFGGLTALDAVSLHADAGRIVGLIGPNGAGKTTLFGVLSGLLRPDAGRVLLDGVDVTHASPQRRAHHGLARTFQRLELFEELSVREHLVVARRVRTQRPHLLRDLIGLGGRRSAEEHDAVETILRDLDLHDLADAPANALPLGTGRLVEVARAVATQPRVLLLDEPSSGLSAPETDRLARVLDRLRSQMGVALVLVEHNVDLVLDLADRVTVLDFGHVIAEGTPAAIRHDAAVQAAYLGTAAT